MSSTSAGDKNPNETVIDTRNGAVGNAVENAGFSSRHSATQGRRMELSIANWRSSRRRWIDEMELKNLRAKKEAEQRQLELEQEHEEIELCRQKKNRNNKKMSYGYVCDNLNESSKTRKAKLKPTKSISAWKLN